MSIERQTIAALKWTGSARLFTQAINWAITLVVVRLLTPPDYGLMALALVIVSLLGTAAELGLGSSLVQVVQLEQTELARVTGAVISLNFGAAALLVLGAPLAALALHEPRATAVIRVSALQFAFSAVSAVPQALLTRDFNFRTLAWIETVSGVLTNLSTLLLAWLGAGVWALVGGYQAGAAVKAVLLIGSGTWVWPRFQLTGIKRHLRFGGALTTARLTWQVSSQVDVLIAGRFLGSNALGIYSVALNLASMPMQKIMSVINQVAFPAVARIQEDSVTLRRHLTKALRLLAFAGVPTAWGLASVAPEFIRLVFGAKWSGVTVPLQILSLLIPVRMLGALLLTAAVAKGRASIEVRNTVITLTILPPAFLVGVQWGVPGLAWAWVAGIAVCYVLVMPRVSSVLGMPLRDMARAALPSVLAGLVMCATVLALRTLMSLPNLPAQLCMLTVSGALSYLGAVSVIDPSLWKDCKALISG
jgi:O-antigen/teichoic acid export membrane protein